MPADREYIGVGAADRVKVFDLMDHLRRAFEDFVNGYHTEFGHMDGFMGVHNFHKLIVNDLLQRNTTMTRQDRIAFLQMARDTFSKAMNDMIAKQTGGQHGR